MVKVRLFAALRELAGSSEVEAEGKTAGEVADALSDRFGERFGQIVAAGDEVALLPPVSGGSRQRNLGV
jgi:molybdopterin converting factor small subunit